jgi:hypothetical protein
VRLKVIRDDATDFRSRYAVRADGKKGKLRIEVAATDTGGGAQSQVFSLTLR